jgi:hypothetical protein
MADEETVDRHLGAVLDEVINAIQETKQAVWSASTAHRRRAFDELQAFLVAQAAAVADAEQRIAGRDPRLLLPTGHRVRNLPAEAHGDNDVLVGLLLDDLKALVSDVWARAAEIEGTSEAELLTQLAGGVNDRVARIGAPDGPPDEKGASS